MTTTRGLLQALGLTSPAGTNPTGAGTKPMGATGPTGPLKPSNYDPPEEVPGPKKKTLTDAELEKALKSLPTEPAKRAEALADLVTKVSDAAKRDPIVRALRDTIAKIQPIMSDADAKKKIDKAIDDLVAKGAKEALMALLKAVVGKAPTPVDRDAPRKDGPNMPEKDLGEKIIKSPEIPLPFDKPPKVRRNSFEFVGLSKSYKPSKYFDFKLRTPDWWEPAGKMGYSYVVIAAKDDYDKNKGRPTRLRDKRIDSKGELSMSLAAPDEPGRYVLYIVVGSGPEDYPVHEFDVAK
jgi:hypothetical protein